MGDGEGLFLPRRFDRSGFPLGAGALGALPRMVRSRRVAAPARALALAGSGSLLLVVIVLAVDLGLNGRMGRHTLVVPEFAINAVLRQQFRVRAALDRLAARDHDDL